MATAVYATPPSGMRRYTPPALDVYLPETPSDAGGGCVGIRGIQKKKNHTPRVVALMLLPKGGAEKTTAVPGSDGPYTHTAYTRKCVGPMHIDNFLE